MYKCGVLHTTPFDAKGPDAVVFLFLGLVDLLTTDEVAFLHSGAQTSSTHDVQEVEFLLPTHATAQEVTVEAKWVARIGGVLTSESQTG
jgi:hypothetical protein